MPKTRVAGAFVLFTLTCVSAGFAQSPATLVETRCAQCHTQNNSVGAPLPETLRLMNWPAILASLETGKMKSIGETLSAEEREAVARYLGTDTSQPVLSSVSCARAVPQRHGPAQQNWNGWADAANTRFQPASAAGLTSRTARRLKLKWSFGFPGVTTALGVPAIVDGVLFVGASDGHVYALDSQSGCLYWSYAGTAGVRVAPVIWNGNVYFGDLHGYMYAVNATTGALLWKVRADEHPGAVITGSPKLDSGRLYVPVSGRDESLAATNPKFECCSYRGSVVALDARTGQQIWKTYTIQEVPNVTGQNAIGARTWGPSGAAAWSSPTLDLQKRVLYVGTGVNYSKPATRTSDAIIAMELESGRILWTRQFTADDMWNFSCTTQDKTNCPRDPVIDADFGSSGILQSLGNGRRILMASDKGGTVFGIDPDREGAILWRQKLAAGGTFGGTMWGGAADDRGIAYIGLSDFVAGRPEVGGGLVALRLSDGRILWMTPAPRPQCLATPGCSAAQPAPVTVIPGVAFLGSWDGHLRAYATDHGTIIWDFDTVHDFQTVNGVKARGGSINAMAAVVAGGQVYITSGYSGAAMPGNVLLAFSVDGK